MESSNNNYIFGGVVVAIILLLLYRMKIKNAPVIIVPKNDSGLSDDDSNVPSTTLPDPAPILPSVPPIKPPIPIDDFYKDPVLPPAPPVYLPCSVAPVITSVILQNGDIVLNWTGTNGTDYIAVTKQHSYDKVTWGNNTGSPVSPQSMGKEVIYKNGQNMVYFRIIAHCKNFVDSQPSNILSYRLY